MRELRNVWLMCGIVLMFVSMNDMYSISKEFFHNIYYDFKYDFTTIDIHYFNSNKLPRLKTETNYKQSTTEKVIYFKENEVKLIEYNGTEKYKVFINNKEYLHGDLDSSIYKYHGELAFLYESNNLSNESSIVIVQDNSNNWGILKVNEKSKIDYQVYTDKERLEHPYLTKLINAGSLNETGYLSYSNATLFIGYPPTLFFPFIYPISIFIIGVISLFTYLKRFRRK